MLFYVLFIEQISDTKIKLYGKEAKRNKENKLTYGGKLAITVIIEREYLHYMSLNNTLDVSGTSYEVVKRENHFFPKLPVNLELLKTNKRTLKDTLNSFSEFTSLVEQFVITRKVKGPGIIEISDCYETNTDLIAKAENIKFVEHSEYPPLTVGSVFVHHTLLKVNLYKLEDRRHRFIKSINYNEIGRESVDILVHHNLHIRNKGGIWTIDTFECAKQLIRGRSFSLNEILGRGSGRSEETNRKQTDDTFCALIKLNILDLCKELCEISGHLLERTMTLRAERTEFLLMHAMYQKKWLIYKEKKENVHYKGGLVLEPMRGLFDNIILIDFNSLYPSIIIESNLCFSTISEIKKECGPEISRIAINDGKGDSIAAGKHGKELALLPKILDTLISRRKKLKQELAKKYSPTYDARQKALKLTANAIYGCLGSTGRFSNLDMAMFITSRGRELLRKAKAEIEAFGLCVIYGDTDSLMIQSNCSIDEIPELSKKICDNINRHFNFINIEMEDVFEKIILYTKKKYAGITTKGEIIMKGIERRDFCRKSNEFIYDIVEILLTFNDYNLIMEKIIELKTNYKTYSREDFVLERVLGKDPEKYASPEGSPQVLLALRINEHIKKNNIKMNLYKKNDMISYIMGHDGAFLPTKKLEINYQYYLDQQFLSPFFRIISVLSNFKIEAVKRLFNIQKRVVSALRIVTPCCRSAQSQTNFCNTCSTEIDKSFLRNQTLKNLREEVELLYERNVVCPCCDNEQNLHFNCFNCNAKIPRKTRNKEFDDFLESVKKTIPDFKIDEITRMSGYRTVNLLLYFEEEINRFNFNG